MLAYDDFENYAKSNRCRKKTTTVTQLKLVDG